MYTVQSVHILSCRLQVGVLGVQQLLIGTGRVGCRFCRSAGSTLLLVLHSLGYRYWCRYRYCRRDGSTADSKTSRIRIGGLFDRDTDPSFNFGGSG